MLSGNGIYGCTQVQCPDKINEKVLDKYQNKIVYWDCCNFH